jgi:hypothetical protein
MGVVGVTLQRLVLIALALAAIVVATPVSAQLYKWVDENGATHYSDRKPDDKKTADSVKSVDGSVSVYSPDKTLLRAVETARDKASQPAPPESERSARPYVAPVQPQPPVQGDPCAYADCSGYYYPVAPAYGFRRHGPPLGQAVLPSGAIAGNVNSPGIIPGTTGQAPLGATAHPDLPKRPPVQRMAPPRPAAVPFEQR